MDEKQVRSEKNCIWVYFWLVIAFFPYVSMLAIGTELLSYRTSLVVRSIVALMPSIVFLPLLLGLRSPYLFNRRHTHQAMGIGAMATALTWVFVVMEVTNDACLTTFTVAVVFFGGSIWGWRQARRGYCWLMNRKGEHHQLPRPWAVETDELESPAGGEKVKKVGRPPSTFQFRNRATQAAPPAAWASGDPDVPGLLKTFRGGKAAERGHAVTELERLGEVEIF